MDFGDLVATSTGAESKFVVDQIRAIRKEGVVRVGDLTFRDVEIDGPTTSADGRRQTVVRVCKDFTAQRLVVEATGETFFAEGIQQAEGMMIELDMTESDSGRWVVADGRILENSCSG